MTQRAAKYVLAFFAFLAYACAVKRAMNHEWGYAVADAALFVYWVARIALSGSPTEKAT